MSESPPAVLIACAHGTRSAEGQNRINEVRADIARLRPELTVLEAYVDVQEPALPDVIDALPAGTAAVVVPLLLSVGYHVRVDIARAVAGRPELTAAAPLGPDPRLARLLAERLAAAGLEPDDGVVLAAAGSSEPSAARSIEALSANLSGLLPNPIVAGYGASALPTVPDAVASLRANGARRVLIASYLLAPGYFHDQLQLTGADLVTAPVLPAGDIAELALERFDQALADRAAAL